MPHREKILMIYVSINSKKKRDSRNIPKVGTLYLWRQRESKVITYAPYAPKTSVDLI